MNEQTTVQKLKSERVQEPEALQKKRAPRPDDTAKPRIDLTPHQVQQRLKSERVQVRLRRMQGWKMEKGAKALDRVREFPDPLVAAAYLSFATQLAAQTSQPLCVSFVGNTLALSLPGRFTKGQEGITEAVLDFAEQLG